MTENAATRPVRGRWRQRVVIVGGGFGGLAAARGLRRENVEVLLIDRTNHHLFQPLLYQVAMAALSPAEIALPIRSLLSRQKNAEVMLGEVTSVNLRARRLETTSGPVDYHFLVLAAGSFRPPTSAGPAAGQPPADAAAPSPGVPFPVTTVSPR